jgi:hypothetical protein
MNHLERDEGGGKEGERGGGRKGKEQRKGVWSVGFGSYPWRALSETRQRDTIEGGRHRREAGKKGKREERRSKDMEGGTYLDDDSIIFDM